MNNSKKKPGIALLVISLILLGLINIAYLQLVSKDFKWREWDTIENLINIHAQALYLVGNTFGVIATTLGILIFKVYQLKKKILIIENDLKSQALADNNSSSLCKNQ